MDLQVKFEYVYSYKDEYGNTITHFKRHRRARKIRMREKLGSQAFLDHYRELRRQSDAGELEPQVDDATRFKPQPGTFRAICVEYLASTKFRVQLETSTQQIQRGIIEDMYDEPVFPGSKETFADFPLSRLTTEKLQVLPDRKLLAGLPEAANHRVKAIRAVFLWAFNKNRVKVNLARDLSYTRNGSEGHHSWAVDEVEQFQRQHPVGTKARLALDLLLWTGVRRSDVVLLGKQHVCKGWLKFRAQKNRKRHPVTIEIPILPALQDIMDNSPTGDLTFLVNDYGRPFTAKGFGNKFRQWSDEAGLEHCSAHGLRKAGAATAAENGATEHQLMAIFGWLTLAEAERYTKAARRKKMAGDGMPLLLRRKDAL